MRVNRHDGPSVTFGEAEMPGFIPMFPPKAAFFGI
jgi:hypothetical protein